ncbi:unnamed protein product [marine sediment metagenome]|uniref:Uncharacterized protein n=1 Tax=marine sediment metagenome TaxID=412755 RepID=X1N7F9_9ZZZZ
MTNREDEMHEVIHDLMFNLETEGIGIGLCEFCDHYVIENNEYKMELVPKEADSND